MKSSKAVFVFFLGLVSSLFGVAHAAVPASATAAVTTMAADGATVATAVLVAIIGVVAIKFIRKGL